MQRQDCHPPMLSLSTHSMMSAVSRRASGVSAATTGVEAVAARAHWRRLSAATTASAPSPTAVLTAKARSAGSRCAAVSRAGPVRGLCPTAARQGFAKQMSASPTAWANQYPTRATPTQRRSADLMAAAACAAGASRKATRALRANAQHRATTRPNRVAYRATRRPSFLATSTTA